MNNIKPGKNSLAAINIHRTFRGYKSRTVQDSAESGSKNRLKQQTIQFSELPDDVLIEGCKFLDLSARSSLRQASKRFSCFEKGDLQSQSLGNAKLQKLARDEAAPWINEQLQSSNQNPNKLIRQICLGDSLIPDALIKKTVFAILEERGANLNLIDENGDTPTHLAVREGHLGIVRILINSNVNLNTRNNRDDTPTHLAVREGHLDIVRILIDANVNLNIRNNREDTPIHLAVREGHLDIVRILIDANVNLDIRNNCDETTFYLSAFTNNDAISEALIDAGADINIGTANKWRPIHEAAYNGKTQLVQLLINRGAYLERVNNLNQTALHLASKKGHLDIVSALISRYIQLEAKDNDGYTALQLAVINNHPDIIIVLANTGADLKVSKYGAPLLHLAVKNNSLAAAQALITAGVELDSIDINNETALKLAKQYGRYDFVQELRGAGAREYSIKEYLACCSIM